LFKIIILVISLLINVYLIYFLINRGLTYSYILDENRQLEHDINNTKKIMHTVFKNTSRTKIETIGLKLNSNNFVSKSIEKGYVIEPFEFLFDDNNKVKDIIYIE